MVGRPKLIIFVEQNLKSIVVIILEPWEYINNSKINKEAANSLYSFAISFYDASNHESGRRRDDGGHGCSVLVRPPSGRCPEGVRRELHLRVRCELHVIASDSMAPAFEQSR